MKHLKNEIAWFSIYLLTALIPTWPLVLHLGSALPQGTEPAGTVPLLNLWTLLWNAQSLAAGYTGYWDAPIFYPERGTFALADPQPLTGLIFAPFYTLSHNQVLAYNLVLLLFLALNGYTWMRLLRRVGVSKGAAILGGLLVQGLPFVTNEMGVLQLTPLFPIFLAIGSLYSFGRSPSLRGALGTGGWTAITFLASDYYGLFLSLFLLVGAMVYLQKDHLRPRSMMQLLAGVSLAGILLLPVIPKQIHLLEDHTWKTSTIRRNSAQFTDYLRLGDRAWGRETMPWLRTEGGSGQKLYPGTGLLFLGVAGVLGGLQRGKQRWVIFCLAGILLAALFSLGLNFVIQGRQPYQLLMEYIPGFARLRSPFRMAVFVQIFLAGLGGFTLESIWGWKGKLGKALAGVLVVASLLEVISLPARLYPASTLVDNADWVNWLAAQEGGAVAMVPFTEGSGARDFEPIALAMVESLAHRKPLVNGYSGFFPQSYRGMKRAMDKFPDERSISRLQEAGVRYLVIDRDWITPEISNKIGMSGKELVFGFDGHEKVVYRLLP